MAHIALILSLIASFWLLRRDLRRRPRLSAALWIPIFFVMVIGSRPLSDWVAGGGYNDSGASNPLDELFFVFVLGASMVIASSRGVKWARVIAANIPLMLIYAYFIAGLTWSDDPLGSAKRIFKDFGLIFIIGLIFSEKDPIQAIRAVFVRSAIFLFPLSIVFDRWFPRFGREFSPNGTMEFSGVTGQKNSLGELILVLCAIVLWDCLEIYVSRPRRGLLRGAPWDQVMILAMGIFLLYQSRSKTALIALVVFIAFIMRKGRWASPLANRVAFLTILSTPLLLFFSKVFGDVIRPIVRALGRDMTFTGRTNIWDKITLQTVNPFVGCGYWNFWRGPRGLAISRAIEWTVPTAHCGYLDIYLDGGIIGLIFLGFFLLSYGLRLIKRAPRSRLRAVGLGFLSAAIVYNLTESSFVRMGLLWFSVLLLTVEIPGRSQAVTGARARMDTDARRIHKQVAPAVVLKSQMH